MFQLVNWKKSEKFWNYPRKCRKKLRKYLDNSDFFRTFVHENIQAGWATRCSWSDEFLIP